MILRWKKWLIIFGIWLAAGILYAAQSYYYRHFQQEQLRNSQLQAGLATAQMQALRMQLHPHFLFNTLNTIAILIKQDADKAQRMVELLSDLLRETLKNQQEQDIPLQQELEFLQHYLQIEAIRFEDRLQVRLHVEPETLTGRVPRLILQPLAENAIRHGIAKRRRPGVIEISAARQNGELLYGRSGLARSRGRLRGLAASRQESFAARQNR